MAKTIILTVCGAMVGGLFAAASVESPMQSTFATVLGIWFWGGAITGALLGISAQLQSQSKDIK